MSAANSPRRLTRSNTTLLATVLAVVVLGGCPEVNTSSTNAGGGQSPSPLSPDPTATPDPNPIPTPPADWFRPGVATTWQWQLQPNAAGKINTSYDVDVYDIDLFDTSPELIADLHAAGRKVICYFSAGTFEDFRSDSGEFLASEMGKNLGDFPDEKWLDIRSNNVLRIMLARLDLAVQKNCDGVEPDNVDGYVNDSGFNLSAADQLAFNRRIADEAHARGLSVGLKNDLDQIPDLVDCFDFAVNEQCFEFAECDLLQPFLDAGKPVFSAEYASNLVNDSAARAALCADARGRKLHTLILPIDLDDSFRFSCEP